MQKFATEVVHLFEVVKERNELGQSELKKFKSFFEKLSDLYHQFSAELVKLTTQEKLRIDTVTGIDGMRTWRLSWRVMLAQLNLVSEAHRATGEEIISMVIEPVDALVEHKSTSLSKAKEKQASTDTRALSRLDTFLAKHKQQAMQSLNSLKDSQRYFQHERDERRRAARRKDLEKNRKEALKTCRVYTEALKNVNGKSEKARLSLPGIMTSLQTSEEMRLQTIQSAIGSYASLQDSFSGRIKEISTEIKSLSNQLKAEEAMDAYISECIEFHGTPPKVFLGDATYDLPLTVAQLESTDLILPFPKPDVVWGSSLKEILECERSKVLTDKSIKLKVPLVMDTLIQSILSLEGYMKEGIFRISSQTDAKEALRKQLESKDYKIQVDDPHVPASVLKAWLRDLSEPVIPVKFYADCLKIGKGGADYTAETAEYVEHIFKQIPHLNQRVVIRILELIDKIEAYAEVNKMTLRNLAVVFSPCLLRAPPSDEDVDQNPLASLQEATNATDFVIQLAQFIRKKKEILSAELSSASTSSLPSYLLDDPDSDGEMDTSRMPPSLSRSVSSDTFRKSSTAEEDIKASYNPLPPPIPGSATTTSAILSPRITGASRPLSLSLSTQASAILSPRLRAVPARGSIDPGSPTPGSPSELPTLDALSSSPAMESSFLDDAPGELAGTPTSQTAAEREGLPVSASTSATSTSATSTTSVTSSTSGPPPLPQQAPGQKGVPPPVRRRFKAPPVRSRSSSSLPSFFARAPSPSLSSFFFSSSTSAASSSSSSSNSTS